MRRIMIAMATVGLLVASTSPVAAEEARVQSQTYMGGLADVGPYPGPQCMGETGLGGPCLAFRMEAHETNLVLEIKDMTGLKVSGTMFITTDQIPFGSFQDFCGSITFAKSASIGLTIQVSLRQTIPFGCPVIGGGPATSGVVVATSS